MLKKLLVTFLSSFLILNSLASPTVALAQGSTWYNEGFKTWIEKVYNEDDPQEIFGERYTAAQVQWVIYSLFAFMIKNGSSGGDFMLCVLANPDITRCENALQKLIDQINEIKEQQKDTGYNPQNQSLFSLIFSTDRPFSGISYTKNKLNNFKLVPTARAQSSTGFGYSNALKPIQSIWTASRDIAYGLFVFVAIVFSFMIMFRVKISPQVVISVQSALPKIVLSLIVVTFSYAIAGFLIDFMYIVIGLFSLILSSFLPAFTPQKYFTFMTSGPFWSGFLGVMVVTGILTFLPLMIIIGGVGVISSLLTLGIGGLLVAIGLGLIAIIFLWTSFKTLWTILKAYANFIITVIFSPLTLVLGNFIPNFSLGGWVRTILSQLAVFVTVGVLASFAVTFAIQSFLLAIIKNPLASLIIKLSEAIFNVSFKIEPPIGWVPGWPPLLGIGGGDYGLAFLLWGLAFVLFTMIPKAADLVQAFISGKPFAFGTAIGEAVAPLRPVGRFISGAAQEGVGRYGGPLLIQTLRDRTPLSRWREEEGLRAKLADATYEYLDNLYKKLTKPYG